VHYSARKKSAAKHDKTLAASGQVLKAAQKRVVKEAAKVRLCCVEVCVRTGSVERMAGAADVRSTRGHLGLCRKERTEREAR
jgi:hypothetical protein